MVKFKKPRKINGEILGRGYFAVVNGRLIAKCGGEMVGSPTRKKDAKREVSRLRRREKIDMGEYA